MEEELAHASRRTEKLQEFNMFNMLRKKTSIITSDAGSFSNDDSSMKDSRREAIYRKVENASDSQVTVNEEPLDVKSEKSYDSESDIDLSVIEQEEAEAEEKKRQEELRLAAQKQDDKYSAAGVG